MREDASSPATIATEVLHGAFDMHVHVGPDGKAPRRSDPLEIAAATRERGMGGYVLKNKACGTGAQAALLRKLVPEVTAVGALTLDRHVGGLNPFAVETEATLGSRLVWMPTYSAANELRATGREGDGVTILDEAGRLLPSVNEILDVAESYGLVLGTGHLGRAEVFALVREGTRRGVKMVVTHPLSRWMGTALPVEDQQELAKLGAFIEHCFVATMPNHDQLAVEDLIGAIRAVGPERCVVSSDFGQYYNPPPVDGFYLAVATLLRHGFTREEVATMVRGNPMALLGMS